MILKIIKTWAQPNQKGYDMTSFFDGFDSVSKRTETLQYIEQSCYACSYFTEEKTEKILALHLMKADQIVRYLAIDLSYTVYLMSNEGKTIERLN